MNSTDLNDERLKLNYLFSLSSLPNGTLPETLKSNYAHLGLQMAEWCNLSVKSRSSKLKNCEFCGVCRTAENTVQKITPSVRPSASLRRILSKSRRNKSLSVIEKKLLLRIESGNFLVLQCLICHKKTKLLYKKPDIDPMTTVAKATVESEPTNKKKKKKHKKAIKAGTLIEIEVAESGSTNALNKNTENLEIDAQSDCEIICETSLDAVSSRTISKAPVPDVIPLINIPAKKKVKVPIQKHIFVNPLAKKKAKSKTTNKRMSTLQLMMDREQKGKQGSSARLRDFLTVL